MSDSKDLSTETADLRALALELADSLSAEIEARYPAAERAKYPTSQRRYDREREPVRRAWALRG